MSKHYCPTQAAPAFDCSFGEHWGCVQRITLMAAELNSKHKDMWGVQRVRIIQEIVCDG
jgi:hypothetical protein